MSRARHPRGAQIAALTPIVRRLHLQELQRVRRDAALRAKAVDYWRDRAYYAEDCARCWQDDVMRMMEDGLEVGLTKSGHVIAINPGGGE